MGDKPQAPSIDDLEAVNKLRDSSRKLHSERMQAGEVRIRAGLIYLDMMTNMEKIGDYCFNVAEMVSHHMQRKA